MHEGFAAQTSPGNHRQVAGNGKDNRDPDEIAQQERHDAPERIAEGNAVGERIDHVDVEADGRGDQPDLDDDQGEDAEPDRDLFLGEAEIEPGHQREEHRHGEQDHRQAVHHAAQHQIDQEDPDQDRHRRQPRFAEQVGELHRNLGQREEAVIDLGADQDDEDHRGRLRRLQQARGEALPAQPSEDDGDQPGRRRADRRALGRREHPEIDAADHQQEDRRDGPHRAEAPDAVAQLAPKAPPDPLPG